MTAICETSNGAVFTYRWLCARHQSDRRGAGWSVRPSGSTEWPCDDCGATGGVTVAVQFVPTRPESTCPAPGWKADPAPERWADRLERLRNAAKEAA